MLHIFVVKTLNQLLFLFFKLSFTLKPMYISPPKWLLKSGMKSLPCFRMCAKLGAYLHKIFRNTGYYLTSWSVRLIAPMPLHFAIVLYLCTLPLHLSNSLSYLHLHLHLNLQLHWTHIILNSHNNIYCNLRLQKCGLHLNLYL